MLPAPRLLAAILVAGFATAPLIAQDYEIRLHRAAKPGDRYHVVTRASDEQSVAASVDGQPAPSRNESMALEYEADVEVVATTPKGRVSKSNITVRKFVRTDATGGDLVTAGSSVVAEKVGDKTLFTVDGATASRLVAKAFEVAGVTMHDDAKKSDDDVFGTPERRKVGDSWSINAAAATEDLVKMGITAKASDLTGESRLVEVVTAGGAPAYRLRSSMMMTGVVPALPPGVTVTKSEFSGTFSGLFPTDVTQPRLEESMSLSLVIEAGGSRDGRTIEMRMTKKTTREAKITQK